MFPEAVHGPDDCTEVILRFLAPFFFSLDFRSELFEGQTGSSKEKGINKKE